MRETRQSGSEGGGGGTTGSPYLYYAPPVGGGWPAFAGHECIREDALSAQVQVRAWVGRSPAIEGNCVAAMWGGEQPEVNLQSVG